MVAPLGMMASCAEETGIGFCATEKKNNLNGVLCR